MDRKSNGGRTRETETEMKRRSGYLGGNGSTKDTRGINYCRSEKGGENLGNLRFGAALRTPKIAEEIKAHH